MKHVLHLALLLAIVGSLLVPSAPAQAQANSADMRAFWVDALNPGFYNHPQIDELVANVERAGANTIFMQVRRHGDAWYNRSLDPRAADPRLAPASEFDPLAYMLEKAHSRGIKVHAWLVVSVTCRPGDRLWNTPGHICTRHGPNASGAERWTTATSSGRQVGDIDFGHPSAINYYERVVQQLLTEYPAIDGIHWDYIRYADVSYGYNQVSLDRFNAAYGRPIGSRPAERDPEWSQWRRDRVTELARRLYIRVKAINPQIQVSAATITWGGIGSYNPDDWPNSAAYSRVFQDWKAWLQEGILDFAVPMHYFDEDNQRAREWYDSWVSWDRSNAGRRTIVVGLGSWLNSPEQNISQIERALVTDERGHRLSGVAFFSYNQPISGSNPERRRAFMDQLRATVFATPAQAPVWPWIAAPTVGHLQGIAAIDGQAIADAKVTLIHQGQWLRDLSASGDGWFGAVDLPPGAYTIVVTGPGGRSASYEATVYVGVVTSM